jgi:hypothetical protein
MMGKLTLKLRLELATNQHTRGEGWLALFTTLLCTVKTPVDDSQYASTVHATN